MSITLPAAEQTRRGNTWRETDPRGRIFGRMQAWRSRSESKKRQARISAVADQIGTEVNQLFTQHRFDRFEEGFTSPFMTALHAAILRYGPAAIDEVRQLVLAESSSDDITLEAVRALGTMHDARTVKSRRASVETILLESTSAGIRDTALISLDLIGDPQALDTLKRAFKGEKNAELRRSLEQVIADFGG